MTVEKSVPTRSLLGEELLNSSPEYVYSWLKSRAAGNGKIPAAPDNIELSILGRNARLITLGVAQYGVDGDALATVFSDAVATTDKVILIACLSNTAAGRAEYGSDSIPTILSKQKKETMLPWFSSISKEEIKILFSNEYIDDEFLTEFLEQKVFWNAISDDLRCAALLAIASNPRMKKNYEGPMDGWAEYKQGLPSSAAWQLAEKVPVTKQYANALGWLYDSFDGGVGTTQKDHFSEMAARWAVREPEEDQEKDKVKKWLTDFERVRQGLFKAILGPYAKEVPEYLAHEDVAFRTAVYQTSKLNADQVKAAYEKDGLIAIEYLERNLWIWRYPASRQALHDACWDADSRYNRNYMDCANAFNYHKERLEKQHPDWFKEDAPIEEKEPVDPAELPMTMGQFNQLSHQHGVELMAEIIKLKKEMSTGKILIYVLMTLLIYLVVTGHH